MSLEELVIAIFLKDPSFRIPPTRGRILLSGMYAGTAIVCGCLAAPVIWIGTSLEASRDISINYITKFKKN